MNATAHFPTSRASGYLQTMCKHFGRKVPVQFDAHSGQITFPTGHCALSASDTEMTLEVSASTAADLDRLTDVVGSHLERFAFREAPDLIWQTLPAIPHP